MTGKGFQALNLIDRTSQSESEGPETLRILEINQSGIT